MITNNELTDILQNGLNEIQNDYVFDIGSDVKHIQDLSKNNKNWQIVDKTIQGIFTTESGSFEAIEGQDLASINMQLVLYVEEEQKDKVLQIMSNFIGVNNGNPFSDKNEEYSIVGTFDALRVGLTSIFQGDDRVPIIVGVTYTIAKKGILSNDITITINGNKMMVLNSTFTMAKGSTNKQYNESVTIKGTPETKSKTMNLVVINTNTPLINQFKTEILDYESIDNEYAIEYNDGFIKFENKMFLLSGSIGITSGSVATLTLTFTNLK